ncbi:MAG: peptidyl-prolyl cis-trans isomerase [Acidobacteria bacterium]|nr:peptidyl-prolyl cis-trans isomerase [Acidobacteriota bacterium]
MKNKTQPVNTLKNISLVLAVAGSLWAFNDSARAVPNGGSQKADVGVQQDAPEMVARVNGEPVAQEELQRMLADPVERSQLLQELGSPKPDDKELERLAIRKLIHRHLILQEAGRRNLHVTEQEFDQALTSLRRSFEDLTSFGMWMKEQGLDDQSLFETLRARMLVARGMGAVVEEVRVTEEQVEQYYEAHKEKLKTEEVWIQIIVVKERETAEEIQAALAKGEDFGRLARKNSLGRRAAQSGDMGWVNFESLPSPLREAVSELKPGEALGPLERGEEFLVVRLEARRPGRTKSLAEARPEIEQRLLASKQQETAQAWLAEQEKKSQIEVFPQSE